MICECCNKHMTSGYKVQNEFFCSDDCLNGWYSAEEYDELCQNDAVEILQK